MFLVFYYSGPAYKIGPARAHLRLPGTHVVDDGKSSDLNCGCAVVDARTDLSDEGEGRSGVTDGERKRARIFKTRVCCLINFTLHLRVIHAPLACWPLLVHRSKRAITALKLLRGGGCVS